MKAKTTSYGQPSIGCYLNQSYRNSVSHDIATIQLAEGFGYVADRETANLVARVENDCLRADEQDDFAQILSECADDAASWLNEQETRPFLWWGNCGDAGAFGLWPNVDGAKEECGFVSSRKADYPPDDYDGEWLHVSDHGNVTLYVRQNGKDTEIWSVV